MSSVLSATAQTLPERHPVPDRRSNRYRNPGSLRYPASVTARGHAVDNVEWGKLRAESISVDRRSLWKSTGFGWFSGRLLGSVGAAVARACGRDQ